jgi:hypothetical protein
MTVAGHIQVAFAAGDAGAVTAKLAAGATVIADRPRPAWQSLNARLQGPAGPQPTLVSGPPSGTSA